jgi:hypothetical protein
VLNPDETYGVHVGDNVPHMMRDMDAASVDLLITSVPFPALYAYTDSDADMGNAEDVPLLKLHLGFFFRGVARTLKPGRVALIHCMQIPRMKRSGGRGLFDFRGLLIRLGERAGLVYEYDWHIRKNPQSQAIRTHSHQLQFAGLEKDRAGCRGALGDYLIKFTAAGDNEAPVSAPHQVTRNDWIDWAEGSWSDIHETDTLNVKGTKDDGDTRHICPLQLQVIDRAVKLFSDPGELVFDPFTGIGSTGVIAVRRGRRFYGCELREDWAGRALEEMAAEERAVNQPEFAFGEAS